MKQEIEKYLESETIKNQQEIKHNEFNFLMVKVLVFIGLAVIIGAIISLFFI